VRGNNHDRASALTPIFPALERHLHDHHKGYIVALGLKVDEVYLAAEITGRQHIMLVNLFSIYFKAIKMASRPLKNPGKWDSFADVRNKPFHGRDYTWRDAANIIIDYWPEVQALLKEIHSVCNRPDTRPPDIFAD